MAADNIIRIMCPNLGCKRVLAVPGHARGKLVRCKSCGMTVRIPLPKEARDAPAATAPPPPQAPAPTQTQTPTSDAA